MQNQKQCPSSENLQRSVCKKKLKRHLIVLAFTCKLQFCTVCSVWQGNICVKVSVKARTSPSRGRLKRDARLFGREIIGGMKQSVSSVALVRSEKKQHHHECFFFQKKLSQSEQEDTGTPPSLTLKGPTFCPFLSSLFFIQSASAESDSCCFAQTPL